MKKKEKSFCQEQEELSKKMLQNAGNTGYYDYIPPTLVKIRDIQGIVEPILYRDGITVKSISLAIAHAILNVRR